MIYLDLRFGYSWSSGLPQHDPKYCFLRDIAKPSAEACQKRFGRDLLSVRLSRLRARHGIEVLPEIRRRIQNADVLLFDLDRWNPNVLIELGIALSAPNLGAAVFILLEEGQDIPSDLNGYLVTYYRKSKNYSLVDPAGFRSALYSELLQRARAKGISTEQHGGKIQEEGVELQDSIHKESPAIGQTVDSIISRKEPRKRVRLNAERTRKSTKK
jgi:hypothetical protein